MTFPKARDGARKLALAVEVARGDRTGALRRARAFAAEPACVGALASAAGRLLFGLGDVDAAVATLERGERLEDVTRTLEYRSLFGRYREAVTRVPARASAEVRVRVAELLERRGDREAAAKELRIALELEPRSARARMALADALGDPSTALDQAALLHEAIAMKPGDATYLGAASRMALGAGSFAHARTFAERLLALDARSMTAHDVLGHLALFRGNGDEARTHADALIEAGDLGVGLTLRGAARSLTGEDDPAARRDLEAATRTGESAWEAQTWLAEVRLRQGAAGEATELADRAISSAQGFLLPARIVSVLARFGAASNESRRPAGRAYGEAEYAEIEASVRQLCPGSPRATDAGGRIALLREALGTLRGNRTLQPSRVQGSELVHVPSSPGPRWASRRLLGLIATRRETDLLDEFARVVAAHPRSGLPLCHQGEVNLWLGRYEVARRDLETVIASFPYSRWAYIGLATLETIEGRHEAALDVLARGVERMDDTTGPGVHGVRGEVLRRRGRPGEAIGPLEHARALSPRRVSASMNLALAYEAAGRTHDARRVYDELLGSAYPLLHDAAGALGATLENPDARGPILEQALDQMLGNRSASVITWRAQSSPIRCLTGVTSGNVIAAARERELAGAAAETDRLGSASG